MADITPFLEPAGAGITALWARTASLKQKCFVVAGYPERCKNANAWSATPQHYDSAIVTGRDGKTIANYRKTFLYSTDEAWSREGERGFFDASIDGLGNTTIGISVDINPYKDNPRWESFEFAKHIRQVKSNLVIISMAWIGLESADWYQSNPSEPDLQTLVYWTSRLSPLIQARSQREVIVVFCNRAGQEQDSSFTGSSAVLGIQNGLVKVYGLLGRGENKMLVVDTDDEPCGFLNIDTGKLTTANQPETSEELKPYQPIVRDFAFAPPSTDEDDASTPTEKDRTVPPQASAPTETGVQADERKRATVEDITPVRTRPKLIIPGPLSPDTSYVFGTQPVSAASEASLHSMHSLLSNGSTNTLRSNYRPPENSTPYPASGMPLSGYPPNAFSSPKSTLTMGSSSQDEGPALSPPTPASSYATSGPWAWTQSESSSKTPLSAAPWDSITPKGQHTTVFPWPPVLLEPHLVYDVSRESLESPQTAVELAHAAQLDDALLKYSLNPSQIEGNISTPSSKRPTLQSSQPQTISPAFHYDSPGPKYTNPQKHSRHPSCDPAIIQKLADISRRAASANRAREQRAKDAANARLRRTQSMNFAPFSEGHPSGLALSLEPTRQGSMVRQRKGSLQGSEGHSGVNPTKEGPLKPLRRGRKSTSSLPKLGRHESPAVADPAYDPYHERAFSRGRQPAREEEVGSILYPFRHQRHMSADVQQQPDLLPGNKKRVKSASAARSRGSRTRQAPLSDFARVEAVVRTTCPVHGAKSRSSSVQNLHEVFSQQADRSPALRELPFRRQIPANEVYGSPSSQPTPRRSTSKSSTSGTPLRDTAPVRARRPPRSASSRNRWQAGGEAPSINSSSKASKTSNLRDIVTQLQQTKFLQTKNWVISTAFEQQLPVTPVATPPVMRSQTCTPSGRISTVNPRTPRAMTFDIHGNLSETVGSAQKSSAGSQPPAARNRAGYVPEEVDWNRMFRHK